MTKRLGRGLAEILTTSAPAGAANLVMLPTEQIRPGRFQPRTAINEVALQELKVSIKRRGVIEPVIVRPIAHGTYELVAGERRWRAAQAVGLAEVPAVIKPLSDKEALEFSLIENIQREDLNPLEEAAGYAKLIEAFGYTQEELASAVGKDRATIANTLRLLKLPTEIQHGLREGKITLGHAKILLGIEAHVQQLAWYQRTLKEHLSVRQLEGLSGATARPARRRSVRTDPQLKGLEDELRRVLGTKVALLARKKGGRIIIEYFSTEDFTRLLRLLGVGAA